MGMLRRLASASRGWLRRCIRANECWRSPAEPAYGQRGSGGGPHRAGRSLGVALGNGLLKEALVGVADTVVAIDAAPEAVAIARDRVRSGNVTFEVADVFSWTTDDRFDVIFFSAWLSHVPMSRFEQFWRMLRRLLAEDGRVLFIDEHVDVRE